MGLYLQVNIILVIYKSWNYSINGEPVCAAEAVQIWENIFETCGWQNPGWAPNPESENVNFSNGVINFVQPDRWQKYKETAAQNTVHKLIPKKEKLQDT